MLIKNENLEKLRVMLKGEFNQRLQELEGVDKYSILATIVNSNSKSNTYGWLGKFPQLKEWVGSRSLSSIKESSYILENKKFESTLSIDRADIEDDNIGMYPALSKSMADEVVSFFNRNIAQLLDDGSNMICYDGQNFFDKEHPVFEKEDGTGEKKLVSNIYGDIKKNPPWFLLCLSGTLKPFLLQQRFKPQLDEITNTTNDTVFMKDEYLFGVRWRGNFGYGFWQQALMSTEPLTAENYQKARQQMQQFKRDGGDPLGIVPTHLVVNVQNETEARKIVEAQIIDNNSNINYKTTELIVSPWLKEVSE